MGGNLTISKVIFNPKEKRIVLKGGLVCVWDNNNKAS
jgi:hypothetical protein